MKSGFLRIKAEQRLHLKNIAGSIFRGLQLIVGSHLHSLTATSTLMSFSKYPEMALFASSGKLKSSAADGESRPYLYTVEVNPYYLLTFGPLLENTLSDEKFGNGNAKDGTWIVAGKKIDGNDEGIELFIEWILPAETIVAVSPFDISSVPQFQFVKSAKTNSKL